MFMPAVDAGINSVSVKTRGVHQEAVRTITDMLNTMGYFTMTLLLISWMPKY